MNEIMQETMVKTRRLGGSLFVRIPKKIADKEGIIAGEMITIKVTKKKKDWFGALKGVGPFTKEDEFDEKVRD